MDFLTLLDQTGFSGAELVSETGFNSSPMTKGVLFRASKSKQEARKKDAATTESPFSLASPGFT
jgi:hypothetical protein